MSNTVPLLMRLSHSALPLGATRFGPFSIDIAAGERIAILGPSGAGKSTLLKLISGEHVTQVGEPSLDEQPIHSFTPASLSHRLAVLPQSYPNAFDLPVRLVIELGRLGRASHDGLHRIVNQAAAFARADHLLGRTTRNLSGGELARVHLARVFAQFWDVRDGLLLVDEPLAAFDPGLQAELFERISMFSRVRNHALVAVLHDVQLALQGFERLLMIKHGKLFADCPASLEALPHLERLFSVRFLTHQVDDILFLHTAGLVEYP
jgi:iron complex transport system ATP-binding protein